MTEELLRNVLKEALEKKQTGLIIWSSWMLWDNSCLDMRPGAKNYDYAMSKISKDKEVIISADWNGFNVTGVIVIPVKKLASSESYFKQIMKKCKEGNYEGPITLIPMNKLSKYC